MKIQGSSTAPKIAQTETAPTQKETAAAAPAQAAWQAKGSDAQKKHLTAAATHAVNTVIAEHATNPSAAPSKHPLLEKFGEGLGMTLGVIVTEALAAIPKWNKPVLDAAGKPVASVPGAERVGNHDILTRHQEVVGPKVLAAVEKMSPGAIHDLLEGLGKGATAAPGASYRLEAAVSDLLHK